MTTHCERQDIDKKPIDGECLYLSHQSVMSKEVLFALCPHPGGIYCDGTLGAGGHAKAILEASEPDGILIGIDRDASAIKKAQETLREFGDRVKLVHGKYSDILEILDEMDIEGLDGLVLDLGISTIQLDDPLRGFSFNKEGPVDMRLDPTQTTTAMNLIAKLQVNELARLIKKYGEERKAKRVARNIKDAQKQGLINTTIDLANVVRKAVGSRKIGKVDSATRTFQALRIAVNNELGELEKVLDELPELLKPSGRMVVISFHSLEDRAVKRRFKDLAQSCRCKPGLPMCTCDGAYVKLLTKKTLTPSNQEIASNPRSRSAKLRAIERLEQ